MLSNRAPHLRRPASAREREKGGNGIKKATLRRMLPSRSMTAPNPMPAQQASATTSGRGEALRMPLQIGKSAVGYLGMAATLDMIIAVVWLYLLLFNFNGQDGTWFSRASTFGVMFSGALTLLFALGIFGVLTLAYRQRATDMIVDVRGFVVEDGPANGHRFEWSELDPEGCRLIGTFLPDEKSDDSVQAKASLVVKRVGGKSTVVARFAGLERDEAEGLLEFVRSRAKAAGPPGDAPAVERDPRVLRCESCGAALEPTDAESTTCPFCAATSAVPTETRERIRAAATLVTDRRHTERIAMRLLHQPGALATNLWLMAYVVGLLLVVPIMMMGTHLGIVVALVGILLAAIARARARANDRGVLRQLALEFAARSPLHESEPHRCHDCGGPLPAPEAGSIVVHCRYCGDLNVLGFDVRDDARAASGDEMELSMVFGERQRLDRMYWVVFALAIGLAAGGVAWWWSA